MPDLTVRRDHLLRMREELFRNLEEADLEFSRVRMRVERMESDLRIGLPEPPDYADAKGHALPQAEARFLDLYRELLKLEDKLQNSE